MLLNLEVMKNNKRASIRLPDDLWVELQKLSEISDTTLSDVIRIILRDYIQLYKTKVNEEEIE